MPRRSRYIKDPVYREDPVRPRPTGTSITLHVGLCAAGSSSSVGPGARWSYYEALTSASQFRCPMGRHSSLAGPNAFSTSSLARPSDFPRDLTASEIYTSTLR
ncbi:Hypothetical protein NTJ_07783 [Nesidiocoris tenuis]|uniref:Uncharacterized protein n=1 Tax=Nesidiocoris tenuis TaxID=355587 RepID=A0ABN7ARZ2_9HEMI|nr:Hypothetical protein NTJ_07783 [Nesidiocoris tenuis]